MTPQERNKLNAEAPICLAFNEGHCPRGGSCKFGQRAETDEDKKIIAAIKASAAPAKGKGTGKGNGKGESGKGKERPPPHSMQVDRTAQKKGSCAYGDLRKFLHS